MKKLISSLIILAVLLCLCSCGEKDGSDSASSKSSVVSDGVSSSDSGETEAGSDDAQNQKKAVKRYYLYAPGKVLKTTYDVDYSVDGTITVNAFDENNYKTGSFAYDYDENGLITYFVEMDKSGNELSHTAYEYNNLMKIDSEYYYEQDALRKTVKYQYNEKGLVTSKTVETVGESDVYTWEYARDGDALYAIYISTQNQQNVEGYNIANNTDGKLYQVYHMINGYAADYYMYDYDEDGDRNYIGYYDKNNSLVEYYSFSYGTAPALAADAFLNTGIME